MRDGALEVETSLELFEADKLFDLERKEKKSVCGKACGWQRQHGRVHFKKVERSVPNLLEGEPYGTEADGGGD
jgi:hypothetical protein